MASRPDIVPNRRAIIDRRALADSLAENMAAAGDFKSRRVVLATLLQTALAEGRAELQRRLRENPAKGLELAGAQAFLVDQLLRLLFDAVVTDLYPATNRTSSERLTLVAVGGYGRGQMAPFSDIDLLFLTPWKQTAWGEQVIETMLYLLWDMGLKVGHATRSLDDMVRMAKADVTIRTARASATPIATRPSAPRCSNRVTSGATSRCTRKPPSASAGKLSPAPPRPLPRKNSPNATNAIKRWATAAMSSSPI